MKSTYMYERIPTGWLRNNETPCMVIWFYTVTGDVVLRIEKMIHSQNQDLPAGLFHDVRKRIDTRRKRLP